MDGMIMVSISENGIISMNTGDYFKAPLFINAGDALTPLRYVLEENDKVYFAILEPNQPFNFGVVRKIFTKDNLNTCGDVEIVLETSDTEKLLPGAYYYEIKLSIVRDNKEYVETIIPRRKIYLR